MRNRSAAGNRGLQFFLWYNGTAGESAQFYAEAFPDSTVGKILDVSGNYFPDAKYKAIRSDVHVATPVPKKSASSVQTGQSNVIAHANTGQSSASRTAIRFNA